MSYTFGDSERAAARLALVARVFECSSAAFLRECARPRDSVPASLGVDLGCGPGHTTQLLQRVLGGARCIGLDASKSYVEAALARASGCEFLHHDALVLPWPAPDADVIYARFLVSHLEDPPVAIEGFLSQLAPGGRLLLDEVEWIWSEAPTFQRYLELVEQVLEAEDQCLFVGSRLGAMAEHDSRTCASSLRRLEVDPRDAAGMFAMNWETLREHPVMVTCTTAAERDSLASELAALHTGGPEPAPITWGVRQVALEV